MYPTINLYLGGTAMPSLSMLKMRLILSLFSAVQTVWLSTGKKIKKGFKMGLGNVDAFRVSDGPSDSLKLPLSSQGILDHSTKEPQKRCSLSRCLYLLRYLYETLEKKHVHNLFPGAFGMSDPVKTISVTHGLNHIPVCSCRSRFDPWHWQAGMWILQIHENKLILVTSHQFSTKPKVF